ncbi:MAG TPA: hypothetical protein VL524_13025, partial [Gemmatimonadaceae bacterium]|nr:hypothetical protein [Gemmatimonadaceae bacterium]
MKSGGANIASAVLGISSLASVRVEMLPKSTLLKLRLVNRKWSPSGRANGRPRDIVSPRRTNAWHGPPDADAAYNPAFGSGVYRISPFVVHVP